MGFHYTQTVRSETSEITGANAQVYLLY